MGNYKTLFRNILLTIAVGYGCNNAESKPVQSVSCPITNCPEYQKQDDNRINEIIDLALKKVPKYGSRFTSQDIVKFLGIGMEAEDVNACRKSLSPDEIYEIGRINISCKEANAWPPELSGYGIVESQLAGADKEIISEYDSRFNGKERALFYQNDIQPGVANQIKYANIGSLKIIEIELKKDKRPKKAIKRRISKENEDFKLDDNSSSNTKREDRTNFRL